MDHPSRSRHVIWVLFSSMACSPRHFRQRETKHPGIVDPQETFLSRFSMKGSFIHIGTADVLKPIMFSSSAMRLA
jgi:hypothetical protein